MSRQVDVKALVSHIVRGDGLDKCRICMGSTKEGQVFLGDTVMMDEGKPVTLAEVLESITGTQMPLQEDLPSGICSTCSSSALNAVDFRVLCQKATSQWGLFIELLENIPIESSRQNSTLFVLINKNQMTIIDDFIGSVTEKTAASQLSEHLTAKSEKFVCPECGKSFHYAHNLYIHLKESTDLKRACYICGEVMSRDELIMHLQQYHNIKPTDCKKCPALFLSHKEFEEHFSKFHSLGSNICIDCGITFQSKNAHHAHMSIHTLKSCPGCDKAFRNQKCYLHHFKGCCSIDKIKQFNRKSVKTKSDKIKVGLRGSVDKKCICDYCGKKFAGKKVISAHIQIVHMKNTHHPCSICGKLLAAAHMTEHMKSHSFKHIYKCENCGMVLKSRLGYVQHLRLHSGERPYACSQCGETFSASSRRSEHMRKAHKKSDTVLKHACSLCSARFRLPYKLRNHLITAHSNECEVPEMKYKCNVCQERFSTCRGLVHHSKKHQNVVLMKRQKRDAGFKILNEKIQDEELCPKGICAACMNIAKTAYEFRILVRNSQNYWTNCFNSLDLFRPTSKALKSLYAIFNDNLSLRSIRTLESSGKHFLTNILNQSRKPFERQDRKQRVSRNGPSCACTDCGKEFHSPYYLNLHLKNSSEKEACWLCASMFNRGEEMKNHMSSVHKVEMLLCKECPMLLKSEIDLKKHEKKCHTQDAFTCTHCGRSFSRQASFELHAQMHMVRTCRACGTQFTNRGCYRVHRSKCEPDAKPDLKTIPRSKRSNIRDPATFICDYCNKTYHSRPQLQNHIIWIHMDIRPHQCQWCGKRFYTPARLAEHTVVHTRERNFGCDICGAKLVSKMAAVYHRRRHTGEKPYECQDCGEKFISASRRSEHAKRRHDRGTKHQCPTCAASFVRGHELKKHMAKAHWLDDGLNKEKEMFEIGNN